MPTSTRLALSGLLATSLLANSLHAQVWEADPAATFAKNGSVGFVLENAGDADGDGLDDVLITDISFSNNRGRLLIVNSLGTQLSAFFGGMPGDNLGHSCAGLGDLDGDGLSDIVVGAPVLSGARPGYLRVYSGASGTLLWSQQGENNADLFGWVVANAGDVDGDGKNDVIVGAPGHDLPAQDNGKAYVYSGADGSLLHSWTGLAAGDSLGVSVGSVGDRDQDGFADLLACAHRGGPNNKGAAFVYSGASGVEMCSVNSPPAGQQYGNYFGGLAGDVNADGLPDFYVIDYLHINQRGRLYVYSGADCSLLHSIRGPVGSIYLFGRVRVGDLDGDGHDDLMLCSGQNNVGGQAAGAVYLYSGATGDSLGSYHADTADMRMGTDAVGIGDVTGDGVPDIAVGVGNVQPGQGGFFILPGAPLPPHEYCESAVNSTGEAAHISTRKSLSLSRAELELHADQLVPQATGVFFGGQNATNVPFGNGTRCVDGPAVRLGVVMADGAGNASIAPILGQGGAGATAGVTWHFQFWYRDQAGGGAGFNYSSGLRLTFRP